ncbi:dihydroorotate dehydrogenase electron transfer subunit [Paenibacillus polymyxa]|uniref:dihydroorotate dehydrogenase electron transfer subunit n=1 Tax=Paenibacillus jamilae TaxID=114136 RepID=UPI0007ABF28B|nr:dihydroorotate dehydrogenase electron transfer subunit [Paenibacillus jamilae]KZE82431.1 diguanylate cyclase [Paenibacillus jamilae]NEU26665.1 dihydroorotate dehydrogenase electron transfer subunit [Paenibacillus polymyxa]QDY84752.1 dihydroorotate dehydrogenase electron transfer subunit [Paenibacillus polymyxa]
MANIISNVALVPGIYVMKIEGKFKGKMGQFYMLRSGTGYPLLPRPISIYDIGEESISFLYRVVGEGTKLFSQLQPGQEIQLEGPFGNGFPQVEGSLALIGGGMGTAPLLLAAKYYPQAHVYLGFAQQAFGVEAFEAAAASVQVKVGGSIVEEVDPALYANMFSCGPTPMLQALALKTAGTSSRLYISTERHMACGIGACLGCTMRTRGGNRRVCKEGPVFPVEEVEFDDLHGV